MHYYKILIVTFYFKNINQSKVKFYLQQVEFLTQTINLTF